MISPKHMLRPRNLQLLIGTHYLRSVHLSALLTSPVVFLGLLVTLWTHKSLMLVVFQSKIIDMPSVLILQAGKDEIVPPTQGLELETCARRVGFDVRRFEVKIALRNEVSMKASGHAAIVGFLKEIGDAR